MFTAKITTVILAIFGVKAQMWPFIVISNTVNLRKEMKQFLSLRSWEWSAEECLFFVWTSC